MEPISKKTICNKDTLNNEFNSNIKGFENLHIVMNQKDFFDSIRSLEKVKQLTIRNCILELNIEEKAQIGFALDVSIRFEECIFKNKSNWNNLGAGQKNTESALEFLKCRFEEDFSIRDFWQSVNAEKTVIVSFKECIFLKLCKLVTLRPNNDELINTIYLIFDSNTIHALHLDDCYRLAFVFENNDCEELSVSNSTIKNKFKVSDFIKRLHIQDCTFENETEFSQAEFEEFLTNKCTFNGKIELYSNKTKLANFTKCIFNNKFDSSYAKFEKFEAKECIFNDNVYLNESDIKSVSFNESSFVQKLYYNNAQTEEMSFSNCTFSDTVKIVNISGLNKYVCFERSTIKGLFFFNGWGSTMEFTENVTVDFSHVLILPSGYVIVRNINEATSQRKGEFDFICANIIGHVVLSSVYARKINLLYSSIVGSFNTEKIIFDDYSNSQTYIKLKNEAIKRNDSISAIKYKAEEMRQYKEELNKDKSCKNRNERILLWLNTISNDNGRSWGRGVCFTVAVSILFYTLYAASEGLLAWSCDFHNWIIFDQQYWIEAIKYLWIADLDGFKRIGCNGSPTFFSYLFYIVGKILIGYGIYQTISAFRKYGK